MGITKVIFLLALFGSGFVLCEDQPCASRDGDNAESFVCVCNSTYCDTVSREPPAVGSYVIYTSSKSGKRLEKSNGIIESYSNLAQGQSEECDISDLYSEMAQEASNQNTSGEDESCAALYFGEDGLGYNMIRIPIGGSDFSTRPYTYNDYPLDDETLSNFTLAEEDTSMKIPMIKAIQEIRKEELKIIASTWCPPVWMKNNEGFYGYGQLKPQYYQSYADYHVRFIEEYEKLDIKIWAITTTNRPTGGLIPDKNINSLGWFPADLGRWLAINLGPTLRSSRYNKTLIFAVDDELHMLDWYLHGMQKADKTVMKYIDGIAVHYYSSSSSPSLLLGSIKKKYKKTILGTQACEGSTGWDSTTVKIGSWERAARYIRSIVDDMNHHSVGWMDFNLFLDKNGGPNWAGNYVDAPILIYPDKDEFIKQPMFYALAHFTKFIPKGSQRITIVTKSIVEITNLSFVTPEGNILIILYNSKSRTVNVHVRLSSKRYIEVIIEKETIKTIEINPNESILCKVQC